MPRDLTALPQAELIRIIYEQYDHIQALERQIAELRAQLDKQGPPKPPLWVKANVHSQPKRDRKKRSHGYARTCDTPTKQVYNTYQVCPDCGGTLGTGSVGYTRQIIELPQAPVEITEHIVVKRYCAACRKRVMPKVDFSGMVVGKQRLGIRLMSHIGCLRHQCRLPVNRIQAYLTGVYQVHLSEGALVKILHKTASKGGTQYDNLHQQIRASPVVYADETGNRENGKNGYDWSFSTPAVHYLTYRKTRSQLVVEEVLGNTFQGVLVSDFYAGYNIYEGFHQRCWVHYLRDIHKLCEEYPDNKQVRQWAHAVHTLYTESTGWEGPAADLPSGIQQQQRIQKQHRLEGKLKALCEPWVTTDMPMAGLASRGMRFLPELFTFIRFLGIEPTNNRAERMVRPTVVKRKISGGTRSEKGSKTRAILTSLFDTWHLQGKNPLTECQLLLASCQ